VLFIPFVDYLSTFKDARHAITAATVLVVRELS